MSITLPETTDAFGNISLVVILSKPLSLSAVSLATDLGSSAAKNITCHTVGDWMGTATTEKSARARKLCQTKQSTALGTTTWDAPTIQYTYKPQSVGSSGTSGNEAYEAMPEGSERYLLQRLGKVGTSAIALGDKYLLWPVELGAQVPVMTTQDAGAEFAINQEMAFISGYDGPIPGTVAS